MFWNVNPVFLMANVTTVGHVKNPCYRCLILFHLMLTHHLCFICLCLSLVMARGSFSYLWKRYNVGMKKLFEVHILET